MNKTWLGMVGFWLVSLLWAHTALAKQLKATQVLDQLQSPWGFEFISDDKVLITEKRGNLKLYDLNTGKFTLLNRLKVNASGQGGLLDIAFHSSTQTLFATYSKKTSQGTTLALAAGHLAGSQLTNWKDRFVSNAYTSTAQHFGSRIQIIDDHIYFTIGDRGKRALAQELDNHAGSIIRLNLDGSIPRDNPYNAIWSYGHRNPQGLFFDQHSQQMWSIEHGPRGGDEINLITKGANYGWPKTSHGKEYYGPIDAADHRSLPGIIDPKLVYIPSIAPSNLLLYRGSRYPNLDGKILAGALKLRHINVVSFHDQTLREENRLFESLGERVRDIGMSPSGLIFFITDAGHLYRIDVPK